MNIPYLNLITKRFARAGKGARGPRPARDWLALLGMTLVLLIAIAGWNYFMFMSAIGEAGLQSGTSAATGPKSATLDDIRNIFGARAARSADYQATRHFIDPSK